MMAVISSCGTAGLAERLEYDFDEGTEEYRLVMALPEDFTRETHQRDGEGNAIRSFHYRDGAELFIACREKVEKAFLTIEKDPKGLEALAIATGPVGEGSNADGSRWKRSLKDGFIVGYDYVKPENVKQYDKAIQSIKIRK